MRLLPIASLLAVALCWNNSAILSGALSAAEPRHRLLIADSSRERIAIIDEAGKTEWEMKIGPLHDLHLLDNGHVLLQTNWTTIVEVDPKTGQRVW